MRLSSRGRSARQGWRRIWCRWGASPTPPSGSFIGVMKPSTTCRSSEGSGSSSDPGKRHPKALPRPASGRQCRRSSHGLVRVSLQHLPAGDHGGQGGCGHGVRFCRQPDGDEAAPCKRDQSLRASSQAEAYTRHFPALSHVILPRGVLSLPSGFPPSDIHLLSPTANLIVRKESYPCPGLSALEGLGGDPQRRGMGDKAGEFPSLNKQDYPVSEQAERFYRLGGSLLYHYLPFWAATFIDRMIRSLSPWDSRFPSSEIMPRIYTWPTGRSITAGTVN